LAKGDEETPTLRLYLVSHTLTPTHTHHLRTTLKSSTRFKNPYPESNLQPVTRRRIKQPILSNHFDPRLPNSKKFTCPLRLGTGDVCSRCKACSRPLAERHSILILHTAIVRQHLQSNPGATSSEKCEKSNNGHADRQAPWSSHQSIPTRLGHGVIASLSVSRLHQ
jgi:hypothetical protein